MRAKRLLLFSLILFCFAQNAFAQDASSGADAKKAEIAAPKPDIANGRYDAHERHAFDLWKPASKKPAPLVVYIHGGGFNSGSKEKLSPNQLDQLLKSGFAVMAINYRLLPEAVFPAHYLDAARAIQFARFHAKEWNIDKTRVAAMGSSAGGLTALWLGFRDDLADPKNPDPILRESTRLSAMAVFSAQTTLEPEILRTRIGEIILKHSFMKGVFFGIKPDEMRTEKGRKLIAEASPLAFLTKDDPPVWAFYSVANKPLTNDATVSDAVHHPIFGAILKEEMDKLKIECRLRHKDDGQKVVDDLINFLKKHLN